MIKKINIEAPEFTHMQKNVRCEQACDIFLAFLSTSLFVKNMPNHCDLF